MKLYIFRRTKEAIAIEDITLDKVDQKRTNKASHRDFVQSKRDEQPLQFQSP